MPATSRYARPTSRAAPATSIITTAANRAATATRGSSRGGGPRERAPTAWRHEQSCAPES
eukprot:7980863-Pyramimonas_sp.AAC.1